MKVVYLAGPIDAVNPAQSTQVRRIRSEAKRELTEAGFEVFDPTSLGLPTPHLDKKGDFVASVNRAALEAADGVFAILPVGVPTYGTPIEIEAARISGKPLVIVGARHSWMLPEDEWFLEEAVDEAVASLMAQIDDEAQVNVPLVRIQEQVKAWARRNFGNQPIYHPLLGAVSEVGELANVYLKAEQGDLAGHGTGIRDKVLEEQGKDAIGDATIFMLGFCAEMGWDFEEIAKDVWLEVSKRDWRKYPKNGRTE